VEAAAEVPRGASEVPPGRRAVSPATSEEGGGAAPAPIAEARWGAVPCGRVALEAPLFQRIDEAEFLRAHAAAGQAEVPPAGRDPAAESRRGPSVGGSVRAAGARGQPGKSRG
jgi:hypothetical protein